MNDRIPLTAADIAAGVRALADLIDQHGLPGDTHPHQALDTTVAVNTVEEVHAFAAQHDLPVREHDGHTRTELALGPNPNDHDGALAAFRGSFVLKVTHVADPEPEAPAAEAEVIEVDTASPNWAPALAMHQALEGAEQVPAAQSPHRAVYECTTHGVTIICGAGSTDEDYEQWVEDVQAHEEQHLAEPVPYELAEGPAPAAELELPQRVRGSHGGFQPGDRVQTPDGPGAVQWAKPVGTFTTLAVEHDDRPGRVVGYLAHQVTLDLAAEGTRALTDVEHIDPDDPTSMIVPQEGDRLRLSDGREGNVRAVLHAGDGSPHHYTFHTDDGDSLTLYPDEIAGYPEGYTPRALAAAEAPDMDDGTTGASPAEVQPPRLPAGTAPLPTWYAYGDGVIAQVGDVVTVGKGRGHWKITELYPAPANYAREIEPAARLVSDTGKRPQRSASRLSHLHLVERAGVAAREAIQ